MTRGDIVIVALPGDLGKPRPPIIVETDFLAPTDHVLVCPGTSHIRQDVSQRRLYVDPDGSNALRETTQFQVDKVTIIRRAKCVEVIGRLSRDQVETLNEILIVVLGLAD